jgi:hypothetical protein
MGRVMVFNATFNNISVISHPESNVFLFDNGASVGK